MKVRNIFMAFLAVGVIGFTSCKDEKNSEATPTQSGVETTENPKTTAALNPAHGQPGHSCAIPVGAPLDGSSANTVQQPTASPASNVSPVRIKSSTATAQKNPPHGQPGHDCTIPVGADLNQSDN